MKELILPLTSVVATQTATTSATEAVLGTLYAVEYRPNDIDTNADIALTCEGLDGSKPLLTLANAGTSNIWLYPRDLVHAVSNAAALTGTAGGDRVQPIMQGIPKAVVTSCGTVTVRTGTIIIYWEPL